MCLRLVLAVLCLLTSLAMRMVAGPAGPGRHSRNVSTNGDMPVADCSGLRISFDGRAAATQSEERTIARSAAALRVRAEENGGIQVQGWDKSDYAVTLCKAAAPDADAQETLSQIKLSIDGGEVTVAGPSNRDNWTAYLLVRAPKDAVLDLRATNGPLGIYGVRGKLTARGVNGPVSLKDCSGEAEVSAENGPISYDGSGGNLKLRTQNGPVNISVQGNKWNGSGMTVDAQNGPLTLHVPADFRSSFVVEGRNAPVSCHASICGQARKTWDDEHKRIEFGEGPAVLRMTTVNGPITVL